ncbi:MAG: hypothetical protein WAP03_06790 [Methylorubrum rhodinum]
MVKAMSFTESLIYTAGQVFGAKSNGEVEELSSIEEMLAYTKQVNG